MHIPYKANYDDRLSCVRLCFCCCCVALELKRLFKAIRGDMSNLWWKEVMVIYVGGLAPIPRIRQKFFGRLYCFCLHCCCICSLLFFLVHFPTKICARCSSLETSSTDLKLWNNVQNGFDKVFEHFCSEIYKIKIGAIRNVSPTPRLWETSSRLAANAVAASPYPSDKVWR